MRKTPTQPFLFIYSTWTFVLFDIISKGKLPCGQVNYDVIPNNWFEISFLKDVISKSDNRLTMHRRKIISGSDLKDPKTLIEIKESL